MERTANDARKGFFLDGQCQADAEPTRSQADGERRSKMALDEGLWRPGLLNAEYRTLKGRLERDGTDGRVAGTRL